MNQLIKVVIFIVSFIPINIFGQELDSIIGRPYKSFDATAYCSYSTFHPSQYLTDNNWDILCAFKDPGTIDKLDSLGISYNKSQLRLLEVGDLLTSDNGVYSTLMPIFSKIETQTIRQQSKEFADSIFPVIESDIKQLIKEIDGAGYSNQTYSLIFSYLLDTYIWNDEQLPTTECCEDHGTWSGGFWAMYNPRNHVKIGTNGFGPIYQNWTDDLGYWLSSSKLISLAKEINITKGASIENKNVISAVEGWGLIDEKGNILIPVLRIKSKDKIDSLCNKITTTLSDAVKKYCSLWYQKYNIPYEKLGQVIFYHEVMWDLLGILEAQNIISMPPILKGEEVGKEHFGDICFIVIDE